MKRFWNKETRDDQDNYYRNSDWGVDRPNDWDNGKGNFTDISPPNAAFDGIPCDWSETGQEWILDTDEQSRQAALTGLESSDSGMSRVVEDLIDVLVSASKISMSDLPQSAQDKITSRQSLRNDL